MMKHTRQCTMCIFWNTIFLYPKLPCIYIRVFHENMFFQKKISATHHASAWGLV